MRQVSAFHAFVTLCHIHRNPVAAFRALKNWKAGISHVYDLRGEIFPRR
jgi:hypothetical protein